jgi:hypothetical protein
MFKQKHNKGNSIGTNTSKQLPHKNNRKLAKDTLKIQKKNVLSTKEFQNNINVIAYTIYSTQHIKTNNPIALVLFSLMIAENFKPEIKRVQSGTLTQKKSISSANSKIKSLTKNSINTPIVLNKELLPLKQPIFFDKSQTLNYNFSNNFFLNKNNKLIISNNKDLNKPLLKYLGVKFESLNQTQQQLLLDKINKEGINTEQTNDKSHVDTSIKKYVRNTFNPDQFYDSGDLIFYPDGRVTYLNDQAYLIYSEYNICKIPLFIKRLDIINNPKKSIEIIKKYLTAQGNNELIDWADRIIGIAQFAYQHNYSSKIVLQDYLITLTGCNDELVSEETKKINMEIKKIIEDLDVKVFKNQLISLLIKRHKLILSNFDQFYQTIRDNSQQKNELSKKETQEFIDTFNQLIPVSNAAKLIANTGVRIILDYNKNNLHFNFGSKLAYDGYIPLITENANS